RGRRPRPPAPRVRPRGGPGPRGGLRRPAAPAPRGPRAAGRERIHPARPRAGIRRLEPRDRPAPRGRPRPCEPPEEWGPRPPGAPALPGAAWATRQRAAMAPPPPRPEALCVAPAPASDPRQPPPVVRVARGPSSSNRQLDIAPPKPTTALDPGAFFGVRIEG